ncbi:hypothetical protein T12_10114 [Trichinella patagoniensis]|uniref:Uncharacterized protein n=1 Tax=Trichinella patagoniensis TaxID=990121 RepID=A0A0V0YRC1_9BILA|nr:hypothetical protein T12_10114 [Trichinella patagoniensis]
MLNNGIAIKSSKSQRPTPAKLHSLRDGVPKPIYNCFSFLSRSPDAE